MKKMTLITAAVLAACALPAVAAEPVLSFSKQWSHRHLTAGQFSEIPAFDSRTNTVWVAGVVGVDVLNAKTGELVEHIDVTPYGYINSVAIHNGLAAFAVESAGDRRIPGSVVFYDTKTRQPSAGISQVVVGSLPDMLTFSHDGSKLLVANEATPNAKADTPYTSPDPVGSVTVIDMATRSVVAQAEPGLASQAGEYLRNNIGMDLEPEYIAVSHDGEHAFVTMQEANAIGLLDLNSLQFTEVVGLGAKDFSLPENVIDPSDEDPKEAPVTQLRAVPVKGLYQPDGIATYQYLDQTYLVVANEGDTREDEADKKRVKDVAALAAAAPAELKRLNISTVDSTPGNLVTFGARSFSIRDAEGGLVYDSGNLLEQIAITRGIYDDKRSDDKGVEPEGVTLLDIAGRTYAFIGLERTKRSAVAVFDVTNPAEVSFIDMLVTDGDVSPEGLAAYHYRGNFYLAIANEVSNTTTLYQIERVLPNQE